MLRNLMAIGLVGGLALGLPLMSGATGPTPPPNAVSTAASAQHAPIDDPIPSLMRLSCLEDSNAVPRPANVDPLDDVWGMEGFGRRKCTYVRRDLKADLNRKMQHVMAHYYEGKLIDFTDGLQEEESKGAPLANADSSAPDAKGGVGFCLVNTVKVPVCELGRPDKDWHSWEINKNDLHNPEDCSMRGLPPKNITDEQCWSSAKVSQDQPLDPAYCGAERAAIGNAEIKSIKDAIKKLLADGGIIAKAKAKYMQSTLDDPDELKSEILAPAWNNYTSAGHEYCAFTDAGVNLATCGKELAWMRGIRISIWQYQLEQVLSEIDQGTINLTAFDQDVYPCGEIARQINHMLKGDPRFTDPKKSTFAPGIFAIERQIKERYKDVKDLLHTDATEACLHDSQSADGSGEIADEEAAQRAIAAASINHDLSKDLTKQVQNGACNLAIARRLTTSGFQKLAYCEVMMRSKKAYYEGFLGSEQVFTDFKTQLAKPCAEWARNQFSIWSCHKSCVMQKFYQCYKGDPSAMKGVAAFFYKYSRDHFPYTATKPHLEKIKAIKGATLPPNLHPGDDIPDSIVPKCDGSGTIGSAAGATGAFLYRRRRSSSRRRRRQSRRSGAAEWLMFVLMAVLVAALAGLGCDSDNEDAPVGMPCPEQVTPQTQATCAANDKHCREQQAAQCALSMIDYNGTKLPGVNENNQVQKLAKAAYSTLAESGQLIAQFSNNEKHEKDLTGRREGTDEGKRAPSGVDRSNAAHASASFFDGQFGGAGSKNIALPPIQNGVAVKVSGHPSETLGGGSVPTTAQGAKNMNDHHAEHEDASIQAMANGAAGPRDSSAAAFEIGSGNARSGSGSDDSGRDVNPPGGDFATGGDAYLKKNGGKTSLFEVINKRYLLWSRSLE